MQILRKKTLSGRLSVPSLDIFEIRGIIHITKVRKDMTEITEKITKAVRGAAEIILKAPEKCPDDRIHGKDGTFNYVTEYDVAVQRYLEKELSAALPGAVFLAEEEGEDRQAADNGYVFVIDPIDGTSNFIHGFRMSAVSVALLHNGQAVSGVVYLPYQDEMFCARRGGGAYLNGRPIHVNSLPTQRSLTLFGTTPYMRDTMCDAVTELFRGLFMTSVDVRRCGAAAADLCFVACGRASAFCEMLLSPWDYAAGALIVTEAGGVVSRFDGSPLSYTEKCTVVAGNPEAYAQVSAICGKIRDKYSVN